MTDAPESRKLSQFASHRYVAAAVIFAVIPFTAIVVLPTNNQLLKPGRDPASGETRQLLERWGRLHAVRSALSLLASVLFILSLG